MPRVIALRIPAVQLAHPEREVELGRFKEEMIVVVHHTIGVAETAIAINDLGKHADGDS